MLAKPFNNDVWWRSSAAVGTCRSRQSNLPVSCALLSKQGQRFLSSLATTAQDPSASIALLRKFVASSSKHVALSTLSHLLSPSTSTYHSRLSSFAFPVSLQLLSVWDFENFPLSINELVDKLNKDEADLVMELVKSPCVLNQKMESKSSELKLDLHEMHLSSAYLILLQWFAEMQLRFIGRNETAPTEILLVCGSGKHSAVRGESPIKDLAKQMMLRMRCPMRIDRKNAGCLIAKGKVFKEWLRQLPPARDFATIDSAKSDIKGNICNTVKENLVPNLNSSRQNAKTRAP